MRSGIILRAGMILKNDQWRATAEGTEGEAGTSDQEHLVKGAINFRRVPKSSLYGLSQPTQEGIKRVLKSVREGRKGDGRVVWINLR